MLQMTSSLRTLQCKSDIWWEVVYYFSVSSAVCLNRKCHGASTDNVSTLVRSLLVAFYAVVELWGAKTEQEFHNDNVFKSTCAKVHVVGTLVKYFSGNLR